MDPTVRAGEKGREGECNYQLAKCIHIPSQKGGGGGGGCVRGGGTMWVEERKGWRKRRRVKEEAGKWRDAVAGDVGGIPQRMCSEKKF